MFNHLTGQIPEWISELVGLEILFLGPNDFDEGPIPDFLSSLQNIEWIFIAGCNRTGEIPTWLSNWTNLQALGLPWNKLEGAIPEELSTLPDLYAIAVQHNQLEGPIPAWLGDVQTLRWLSLEHNQFTGNIPLALRNLTDLQVLALGHNKLEGNIPDWIGELTDLRILGLNSNKLIGEIPSNLKSLIKLGDFSTIYRIWNLDFLADMHQIYYSLDVQYNALYTTEAELSDFLESKQIGGNWKSTQTISPTELNATLIEPDSVKLSWTPIVYSTNPGGYEIFLVDDGSYIFVGITPDKNNLNWVISNLEPGKEHCFALRSVTDPHDMNLNTVYSNFTEDVCVTTPSLSPPEAIENLISDMVDIDLPEGIENGLTSKLDSATFSLEKGKTIPAINKLNAFINLVEAQRGKMIYEDDADALIAEAQRIIDSI